MRWFWIDRFTEFVSGKYAVALKSVSLSEEVLDEYSPGWPYLPASLVIEGMAQTGGLLVAQLSDFRNRVVLAKVGACKYHNQARPADTLVFRAELTSLQPNGAFISGTVELNDRPFCELDLMFAFLNDERFDNVQLFEPAAFCRMLRLLRLFDVAKNEDGRPVDVPQYMLDAERVLIQSAGTTSANGSSVENSI